MCEVQCPFLSQSKSSESAVEGSKDSRGDGTRPCPGVWVRPGKLRGGDRQEFYVDREQLAGSLASVPPSAATVTSFRVGIPWLSTGLCLSYFVSAPAYGC